MKLFNKLASVLAVIALTLTPALAQEISAEHLDMARKFVTMTDRSQVFEPTVVQTGINTLQTLTAQNPGVAKELEEAVTETIKSYRDRKGELMDQFARVYAVNFTLDELTEIVAFYETDVGKKLLDQNYAVNQQLQAAIKIFDNNLKTEFLAKVRALLKEKGIDV